MAEDPKPGIPLPAPRPPEPPRVPGWPSTPLGNPGARTATRGQRLGLIFGVLAALLFAIWWFSPILTPFVLASCIAYFLDPLADQLERFGVRRGLGAFLLIFCLFATCLLALLVLYPLVIQQIGVLLTRLPAYVTSITNLVREALERAQEAFGPEVVDAQLRDLAVRQAGTMVNFLGTGVSRLIGGGVALVNVFTLLVVTPVVAFYLLRDWPSIVRRVDGWLPRRSAHTLRQLARDTDRVLSAWLRGQLLCCLVLAVFYAVGLQLVGLELGLMIGLLAGVLSFIPYVGSITGFACALLLAAAQFGTWEGVGLVVLVFMVGQFVEGYIIYPRLLGDRVELHAVWVIFALFAGGVTFGFLGVLLAVPMAAAVGVLARYWLRRYLESPLYLDPPRTGR